MRSLDEIKQNLDFLPQTTKAAPLLSGLTTLDDWLQGGLAWGKVSEWGMPLGSDTRSLLLTILRAQNTRFLWIYAQKLGIAHASAWSSRVDLSKAYFATSDAPLRELKACFLQKSFPLIVIDSPLYLSLGDLAFLQQQARAFSCHYFLLRPYYLSSQRGNPFCSLRSNCFKQEGLAYILRQVKGQSRSPSLRLSFQEIEHYECSHSFVSPFDQSR